MAIIRRAEAGDVKGIHEAHMRSIREVCSRDHSVAEIQGWGNRPLDERQRLQSIRDRFVWVIEELGRIKGFSELHFLTRDGVDIAYIQAFYLTPEVIGQGLGKRLLQIMVDQAIASGVKKIALNSTITAHEFYRRFGFKDDGEEMKVEVGGSWVRNFPMSMAL